MSAMVRRMGGVILAAGAAGAVVLAVPTVSATMEGIADATRPVSGYAMPAMPACRWEDGSGGQAFPCYWNGGPNQRGRTYVLTAPLVP